MNLRMSSHFATVLAGLIFVLPTLGGSIESYSSTEASEFSEPDTNRTNLFEQDSEPLAEAVLGKWVAKVDYLLTTVENGGAGRLKLVALGC